MISVMCNSKDSKLIGVREVRIVVNSGTKKGLKNMEEISGRFMFSMLF